MRLPFTKKKDQATRQSSAAAPAPRRKSKGGVPETALARPRRQGNHWENGWAHPPPDHGQGGIAGYLNGIQKPEPGQHPTRFVYLRPDGRQDDDKPRMSSPNDAVVPARASTRPVPKGFFGP